MFDIQNPKCKSPTMQPRRAYTTSLPHDLRTSMEYLSGLSMDDVQVHYNSPHPLRVQALAYTRGIDIYVGPGQEYYLAHEAWHVVQQKRGCVQPTMQLNGVAINDEEALEREADVMGAEALQLRHAPGSRNRLSRRQPPIFPVVQRQLTLDAQAGYYYDNRDLGRQQHFTKAGAFVGLTGNYVDQDGYTYAYDDGTRQYRVTGGAANQYWDTVNHRQYTRSTGGPGNILHIYTAQGGNRYYYQGNLYNPVPSQRVTWVDNQGRFVEALQNGTLRVLTNNGQRVQKHYLVAKLADRNFVLPVKVRQHFTLTGQAIFVPGLPNLCGGNLDPQDANPQAAVTREAGEETDFAYTTVNVGPQLGLPVDQGNNNQLNFHAGTVRTTTGPEQIGLRAAARPFNQEMDLALGVFTFKAHQIAYQPGVTTDQNIRTQILALFSAQKNVVLTHAFFTAAVVNRTQTPLQEFHGAHATAALVDKVKADHQAYYTGLARGQAGLQAANTDPEHVAGRLLYTQGLQDVRTNTPVPVANAQEPAYTAARTEYTQGLLHARTNVGPANTNVAYTAARDEYTLGLLHARTNVGPANTNVAYTAARDEYTLGLLHAQTNVGPANTNVAYTAARDEYTAGWQRARDDEAATSQNRAYMAGFNEYTLGRQQAQASMDATSQTVAYLAGFQGELEMDTSDH